MILYGQVKQCPFFCSTLFNVPKGETIQKVVKKWEKKDTCELGLAWISRNRWRRFLDMGDSIEAEQEHKAKMTKLFWIPDHLKLLLSLCSLCVAFARAFSRASEYFNHVWATPQGSKLGLKSYNGKACLPRSGVTKKRTKRMMNLTDKNQLPHLPGDSLSSAILWVPGFGGKFYLYIFILVVHYKDDITLPGPPLTYNKTPDCPNSKVAWTSSAFASPVGICVLDAKVVIRVQLCIRFHSHEQMAAWPQLFQIPWSYPMEVLTCLMPGHT